MANIVSKMSAESASRTLLISWFRRDRLMKRAFRHRKSLHTLNAIGTDYCLQMERNNMAAKRSPAANPNSRSSSAGPTPFATFGFVVESRGLADFGTAKCRAVA
jgi:hypothetical protein